MSARATASICCSPPESVPASCSRRSLQAGKARVHALDVLGDGRRRPCAGRRRPRGSPCTLICGNTSRFSGTSASPRATMLALASPAISCAGEADGAAPRLQDAGDGVHQRGLAGAVRAQQAGDAALPGARARRPSAPRSCRRRWRCRRPRACDVLLTLARRAEVGFAHLGIGLDLGRRALRRSSGRN